MNGVAQGLQSRNISSTPVGAAFPLPEQRAATAILSSKQLDIMTLLSWLHCFDLPLQFNYTRMPG